MRATTQDGDGRMSRGGAVACFAMGCALVACGGDDKRGANISAEMHADAVEPSMQTAGRAAAKAHQPRWSGIQFCEGHDGEETIKTSEETTLGGYEKTRTRVKFAGIRVGPSKKYSCVDLDLEALVTMSDKSGAYFEGGSATPCTSETGKSLTAKVGIGYDSDLRYIQSSSTPKLSLDVALDEVVDADGGLRERLPAHFRCSFDLELK